MVTVVHCVSCVSELAVCNSSLVAMEGRIAARPLVKNGEANISSPLSRNSSQVRPCGIANRNSRAIGGAHQVAGDHDFLAIQAVQQHARHGPGRQHQKSARQQNSGHHQTGAGVGQRQTEHGNVIEVVANLADHLPGPGEAVIAVGPRAA